MKSKLILLTVMLSLSTTITYSQIILNYFNGSQSSNNIVLNWESGQEMNQNYYTVERSIDNISFSSIQQISASGNSASAITYQFSDNYSFADICYYYRLVATAFDGNTQYLDTITVCYSSAVTSVNDINVNYFTRIYPNPNSGNFIYVEVADYSNCVLTIFNSIGESIFTSKINSSLSTIDCSNYASGNYLIQFTKGNTVLKTDKFIIE